MNMHIHSDSPKHVNLCLSRQHKNFSFDIFHRKSLQHPVKDVYQPKFLLTCHFILLSVAYAFIQTRKCHVICCCCCFLLMFQSVVVARSWNFSSKTLTTSLKFAVVLQVFEKFHESMQKQFQFHFGPKSSERATSAKNFGSL